MNEFEELESKAVDVSNEFESMEQFALSDFLRSKSKEPSLKIHYRLTGNYDNDKISMRRLKAFLETRSSGQKRFVTVSANEEQYSKHPNEFQSGIKWEKI